MPIHPSLPPRAAARTRSDVNRPRSDERRLRAPRSGESSAPVPSLNEAAVKAVVSIIRAHPRRFLKDADFRASIRRRCIRCFACLGLDGRSGDRESVVVNLTRAIGVVERASEGGSDPKELKRASLQLSMIADLGADKDVWKNYISQGSNAGVTACAHLYLGVVYGLRRKDRASARHLLQVFNDSPFNARTALLPELWDRLFRPQFAHLDEWFNAESAEAMSKKARMIEKVYNGALDAGTVRFALYYKEWLADVVVEAPDFPLVAVPSDIFSSIPNDFVCPLTSQLFEEPVTLETGQTVERVAYKEWLDRGNKTCPITGRELQFLSVPITNLVLKRIIDKWKSDRCKNLLVFATELAGNNIDHHFQSKDEAALFIVEQLLTGFSNDEGLENARHLISLGGLSFLIRRLELGDIEERTRVVELLCCCIRADGGCRNYLAQNINRFFVLDLLLNKQAKARTGVVSLLIELICLNRERQRHSIYREEAVDAIAVALEFSLTDEKVLVTSCRALLMLGGYFSFSGDITTMNWMLNHAGYCDNCRNSPLDIAALTSSKNLFQEGEEEEAKEEWLRHMTVILLGNGKKSFLEALSKCLGSGNSDLRKACLTTVAWLSHALASVSDAEFQLSTFLALIPHLKVSLEDEKQVEHRVLASLSLLNFSKFSGECKFHCISLVKSPCFLLEFLFF
ncbi:putative E3 ubiquitin-protein ligase LIN [Acorus gramineus]|uniref:RING-type E3 ubiquitin transferase n=1 Tax=Acorus gramineus TaxID=55184 RepID=A0AAV9BBY1_ACOGR|nr:putative E3 ubiquitin-protein ligase LIN [Acorus gramineus]